MLDALVARLRAAGITRIDTACHRDNAGAWRFYERHGFRALDEERIARVIGLMPTAEIASDGAGGECSDWRTPG